MGSEPAPPRRTGPADEVELARRAHAGDRDAYGLLIAAHGELAFRVAYLLTSSASDAEDAAQDGFVKAYLALDRYDPERPFRPWLLQIVANEARNRRRSQGRRERLALRAATVGGVGDRDSGSAEDLALGAVSAGELRAALARLDDRDRTVIALRYFAGLSEAETASALDVPAGTVKSRLSRALDRLRAQLGDAGDRS